MPLLLLLLSVSFYFYFSYNLIELPKNWTRHELVPHFTESKNFDSCTSLSFWPAWQFIFINILLIKLLMLSVANWFAKNGGFANKKC